MPVSITATAEFGGSCTPAGVAAEMRDTPVGTLSPGARGTRATWTGRSGVTVATASSVRSSFACRSVRRAANPGSALR